MRDRTVGLTLLLVLLLAVLPLLLGATTVAKDETVAPDSPAITAPEILEAIRALADDAMEGRESGRPGCDRAAAWIAGRMKDLGLHGAGTDGTFFQAVPIPNVEPAKTCALKVGGITFTAGDGFAPFGGITAQATALVAFGGYGITSRNPQRDDYEGLDVRGKIVLLFRHEPHEGTPEGTKFRRGGHSSFDRKIRNAQAHGAAGVILVNDPLHHPKDEMPGSARIRNVKIPAVFAKRAVLTLLFGDRDPRDVQRALDTGTSPAKLAPADALAHVAVAFDRTPLPSRNVVGFLPGSDPALRDEVVVIGAHYDHLGQRGGTVMNGADDNASGTAAVLEVMESLAQEGTPPKRTVLAILFTGEEKGLHGSRHYVKHPLLPLAKTVTMVNLDMVGRLGEKGLYVGGVGTSPGFDALLTGLVADHELKARFGQGGAAPSDNTPFYRAGIPALFFFTGIHRDYHRASDDWEKINAEGAAHVSKVVAAVVRHVASTPTRPAFRRAGRAYLGVMQGRGGPGALLQRVMPGTPAAKAGLRSGDRIVAAGGKTVASWSDLRKVLGGRKPGDSLRVEVRRGESRIELELVLGER